MDMMKRIAVSSIKDPIDLLTKNLDAKIVEELAKDISVNGQIVPILVYDNNDGTYTRSDGGHRIGALVALGETEALCVVRGFLSDISAEKMLVEQITANSQRRNTNRKDFVEAISTLNKKFGYTVPQIVEKLGVSQAKVYSWLDTLQLPTVARDALDEGNISLAHAGVIRKAQKELGDDRASTLLDEMLTASDKTATDFDTQVKAEIKALNAEQEPAPQGFQAKAVLLPKEVIVAMMNNAPVGSERHATLAEVLSLDEKTVEAARTEWEQKEATKAKKAADAKAQKATEALLKQKAEIDAKLAESGITA